jgi:Leucine-rich repeat (LRR) protein
MNKKYLIISIAILLLVLVAVIVGGIKVAHKNTMGSTMTTSSSTPSSGVLDEQRKGLTQVTSDIYNQTDTTSLILSYNAVQTLPSQMGMMTKLAELKIDHNQLKGSLIGEVRQMTQLQTLDLSCNNMTGMPAEIGQLHMLQTLNYSHNQITGLPNELANLKNTLRSFDLTGNPLSATQITQLKTELPNTTVIF